MNTEIKDLNQLNEVLTQWLSTDDLPDNQTVEVPLYVIKEFMHQVQDNMYLSMLKNKKAEIEKQIRRMEKWNYKKAEIKKQIRRMEK